MHRRARRHPVVDEDCGSTREGDPWLALAEVPLALLDPRQLHSRSGRERCIVGESDLAGPRLHHRRPVARHRTHGQFRLSRSAHLVGDQDVQRGIERLGEHRSHGDTSAWDREHDCGWCVHQGARGP